MRFNEQQVNQKPEKEEKKEPVVKAGEKGYDYSNLSSSKKILTGRGEV